MKNVLTKITKLAFIFRTRDGGSSIRLSKTFFFSSITNYNVKSS